MNVDRLIRGAGTRAVARVRERPPLWWLALALLWLPAEIHASGFHTFWTVTQQVTPPTCAYSAHGSSGYAFCKFNVASGITWDVARAACNAKWHGEPLDGSDTPLQITISGGLLVINSETENAWVRARADQLELGTFWTAGNRAHAGWEDDFWWAPYAGEPALKMSFEAWALGEPNNYLGVEDCIEMSSGSGEWNDQWCGMLRNFVCEHDCDDGDACTADSFNLKGGMCEHHALVCDDGDPCTDDHCQPGVGCVNTPNTAPCDDGNPCTSADTCASGVCSGSAIVCEAGSACTESFCGVDGQCSVGEGIARWIDVGAPSSAAPTVTSTETYCGPDGWYGSSHLQGVGSVDYEVDLPAGVYQLWARYASADARPTDVYLDDALVASRALAAPTGGYCGAEAVWAQVAVVTVLEAGSHALRLQTAHNVCCFPHVAELLITNRLDFVPPAAPVGTAFGEADVPSVEGAPCSDGTACTVGDACASGQCVGAPVSCDDDNPCTTDFCDPMAGCQFVPNELPCGDASACTLGDTCSGGACVSGGEVSCDDGNPCMLGQCVPEVGCVFTQLQGACDDGSPCTLNSSCVSGACEGWPIDCPPGAACTTTLCDDLKGCTAGEPVSVWIDATAPSAQGGTADTSGSFCDPAGWYGGAHVMGGGFVEYTFDLPAGVYNVWARYASGEVRPTNLRLDGALALGFKLSGTTGGFCGTEASWGKAGAISIDQGGLHVLRLEPAPSSCCLPHIGELLLTNILDFVPPHAPAGAAMGLGFGAADSPTLEGSACSDGNPCTSGEVCAAGSCVGAPISCDDGNPCTDDFCDPAVGCQHVANSAPCDDGDACTTADTCAGGACVGGPALACDDGNPCTDSLCSPSSGCAHVANQAPCDDFNVCTVGDVCAAGSCASGPALNCDDGNPCTADACDAASGCEHTPQAGLCDDGSPCTTGDTCAGGVCVGIPVSCPSESECTASFCDAAGGCAVGEPFSAWLDVGAPSAQGGAADASTTYCDAAGWHESTHLMGEGFAEYAVELPPGVYHLWARYASAEARPVDVDLDGEPALREVLGAPTGGFCGPEASWALLGPVATTTGGAHALRLSSGASTCCFPHISELLLTNALDYEPPAAPAGSGFGAADGPTLQGSACSDGSLCTAGDACAQGECVGTPVVCDDGDPCTIDSCDHAAGCLHAPDTSGPCGFALASVRPTATEVSGVRQFELVGAGFGPSTTFDIAGMSVVDSQVTSPQTALVTAEVPDEPGTFDVVATDAASGAVVILPSAIETLATGFCSGLQCGLCDTDADCIEGDPCTQDYCGGSVCIHAPTASCCPNDTCDSCTVGADVNADGMLAVTDVQCMILVALWFNGAKPGVRPACVKVPLSATDFDCNGAVNVADVLLSIQWILYGVLNPVVDTNGDGCHDNCLAPE